MGELSRGDPSVIDDDLLAWSKEVTSIKPLLEEAPFEELCGDNVTAAAPSFEHIELTSIESLDMMPILSPLLLTTSFLFHVFHASSGGDIRGCHPSFDPCCAYPEDVPRKIM